jgi:hypothetical protein
MIEIVGGEQRSGLMFAAASRATSMARRFGVALKASCARIGRLM